VVTSNDTRFSRAIYEHLVSTSNLLLRHGRIVAMAPAEPTSGFSSAQSLTLPEVIFSCGICQATVSEVYTTLESNKGFHSGSGDDHGIVTRLWIA
jgi:hypothetical protein